MDKKIIGYIVGGVGLLIFALSYPGVRALAKIPSLGIPDLYLVIGGVVIFLVGAFLAFKGAGSSQPKEVPIYEGHGKERKIVAIQRMGK